MEIYNRYILPRIIDRVMRTAEHQQLRRRVLASASGRVLEIGVGTGLNLPHYPPHVRQVTAVDVNPGMHALAKRRARGANVVVEHVTVSAERLPLEDASFDTVVSTWTLCSIPDVAAAMREIQRVLKPGGRFLFVEHGLSPEPSVQRWQHRLTPLNRIVGGGCHLDRDMRAIIGAALDFEQFETFYLERMPKLGGFTYLGKAMRK